MKKTIEEIRAAKIQKDEFYKSIDKVSIPEYLQMLDPRIKIFIGGCIERGIGSSFRHTAHAHNSTHYGKLKVIDPDFGTICFRSIKRIGRYKTIEYEDGSITIKIIKPSQTLLHEIAHILTPNHGHDKKWLEEYIKLGASKGKILYYKNRFKGCN